MATGKPLDIIVDEALFDLPEIAVLVEEGHTVKKLLSHGYDLILGPKAMNLTVDDMHNPKLLAIAIEHGKKQKYGVGGKRTKKAEVVDGVENKEAPKEQPAAGGTEDAPASKPAPRKRKPRAKKQAPATDAAAAGKPADPVGDPGAGAEGGGK